MDKEGFARKGRLLQAEVLWCGLLSLLPDVPRCRMVPGELRFLLEAHGMDAQD